MREPWQKSPEIVIRLFIERKNLGRKPGYSRLCPEALTDTYNEDNDELMLLSFALHENFYAKLKNHITSKVSASTLRFEVYLLLICTNIKKSYHQSVTIRE